MSLGRRITRILTLRCEEASALISQEQDDPPGLPERLALGGHLLACGPCRRFRDQLRQLRSMIRGQGVGPHADDRNLEGLSPTARDRIATAMRIAREDDPASGS